jgi:hypothetical protein
MTIHFDSTELEVIITDESYRYRRIMGEHHVVLYYNLPAHIEVPVGAYIEYQGRIYTLEQPVKIVKNSADHFEYTATFEAPAARLTKYKYRNTVDGRLKFPLTATPQEHLQLLIDNLNARESGWTIGSYPSYAEKLISYNHDNCHDALKKIAEAFETEWEIDGKEIRLGKVEHAKSNPLALSYGRNKGILPGSGRANYDESRPTERLWVQGGERNIDPSTYGGTELKLPTSQTLQYDGEFFFGEPGFNSSTARSYISSADGLNIIRSDKPLVFNTEDSLDLSNIYPSRIGTVSSVVAVNAANNLYDFTDSSIPSSLDYTACLIKGQNMTVYFESGMLAGRTFDVSYVHASRTFKIVPTTLDGIAMPNSTFKPATGDKYAIFGIMLPSAYIGDNTSKTGASWDMFRQAVKYLYDNEEAKFTVTGEVDSIWSKKNWLDVGGRLDLGYHVLFSDPDYMPAGANVRIVGVKDYINNPYKPKIELSNKVQTGGVSSTLKKLEENEVVIETTSKANVEFTKRRYRDAIETMEIMEMAMAKYFTAAINPAAVHTMSLLVGHESLQFRFVDDKTTPTEVVHTVSFNQSTKVLSAPGGIVQHLTIGIENISSTHAPSEYKFWTLPEFTTPPLIDADKSYLLYAKVSKSAETGEFVLSETPIDIESVSGYYHLWVGILNTEYLGERSYVDVYGFTEILPGRITAKRLVTEDGNSWIDFVANSVRIGNELVMIDWNNLNEGSLTIMGAIVQSPSGDEDIVGVFRGEYDPDTEYFRGDVVEYTNLDGRKGRYKYISLTSGSGNPPTDTDRWRVEVEDGLRGGAVVYRGVYDADETYYGNSTRIDVVKYGSMWYEARATAGEFTGVAPSGGGNAKWKYFGASFSSVATDLLLADKASIGNWWIEDGKIVSRLLAESGETYEMPQMSFDANIPEIRLTNGGTSVANVSEFSPKGFRSTGSGMNLYAFEDEDSPLQQKATVIGNARGAVVKNPVNEVLNFIAGHIGVAQNSGTAPAYGGYFENLFAQGLNISVETPTSSTTISKDSTCVFIMGSGSYTINLPLASFRGQTILIKNISGSTKTIAPLSGNKMYDDDTENPAYPIENKKAILAISLPISGVMSWIVTKFGD